MAPAIGLTKTATPSPKRAFVVAPVFAMEAEALEPKSTRFSRNRSMAALSVNTMTSL
jgi:hypothetical protein